MPIEDLQGDWNAVSFSIDELGRCTAVLELHLLDRNRGNIDLTCTPQKPEVFEKYFGW